MKNNSDRATNWVGDSKSFDSVAELYDKFRPSYPADLIEHILSTAQIKEDSRILEIGSGTGIATALFAQRGYSILCIEPGENLVAVARRRLRQFARIEFVITSFESWSEQQSTFDLAISAQAFHWIPKEIGYAKTAKALRGDGCIALFWNMYPDPKGEIYKKIDRAYQKYAPDLVNINKTPYEDLVQERKRELAGCGYFDRVELKRFPWSARYSAQQYVGLLNTYSDHLRLPEENLTRLFEEITEVIFQSGGYIDRPYVAVVYTGRKAA